MENADEDYLCLIDGRFLTVDRGEHIEIIDIHAPGFSDEDCPPLARVPLEEARDVRTACMMALAWLHDNNHLALDAYLREAEEFWGSEARQRACPGRRTSLS